MLGTASRVGVEIKQTNEFDRESTICGFRFAFALHFWFCGTKSGGDKNRCISVLWYTLLKVDSA